MGSWDLGKLILAGLIGAAIGWMLKALRGGTSAEDREMWEAKIRGYDRDLDVARVDLRSHKDQITSLKSELAASNDAIKVREAELAALRTKLAGFQSLEAELSDKKSEIASLGRELDALKAKLAEAETAAADSTKKSAELNAKMTSELETLKKNLSGKDEEINMLLARVKEMAPLGLQLKDRELKLREWDTKHAQALKVKDDEIAELKVRLIDLDAVRQRAAEAEAKLKALESELDAKHEATLKAKDNELNEFQARAIEFESAKSRIAELESKLQAAESSQVGILRDKESAILLLEMRIKELEPLSAELAERDAKIRDLEARLQAMDDGRGEELESATDTTRETDEKSQELEEQHRRALADKDAEIAKLLARIDELGQLSAQLSDRDVRLAQLEAHLHSATSERDEEINRLRLRIGEFESGAQSATDDKDAEINRLQARINKLESSAQSTTGEKDTEIDRLRGRIGELESQIGSASNVHLETAALRQRINDLETMYTCVLNPPAKADWDDLKLINGVGPAIEKMLHKLGVYTFKQVGLWNDEQIDWVDSQLENFHGRIRRENWVESAKDEYLKKYNEKLN